MLAGTDIHRRSRAFVKFRSCVGEPAQRFIGFGAKVEAVDIVFRADYCDLAPCN